VLVFVVGSLLVGNVWAVVDAKITVTAAARQATRTFVEAPDALAAETGAQQAALEVITAHGRSPDRFALESEPGTEFVRCAPVGFAASYRVELVAIPFLGGIGRGFTVTAIHRERVDPFRSGVDIDPANIGELPCG